MRKKLGRNQLNSHHQSGQPSSSSASLPFSYESKNKVAPEESRPSSASFCSIDASLASFDAANKNRNCSMEKCETRMTNEQGLLLCEENTIMEENDEQLEVRQESAIEKVERRNQKRERQKEKKLGKKMAAERRESELSLGEFLDEDHQGLSSSVPSSKNANSVSLCRHPITTLEYFLREIPCLLCDVKKRYVASRRRRNGDFVGVLDILLIVFIAAAGLILTYLWIATKDPLSVQIKGYISWYFYWIFLGILSSVGLGTGLHTFILYLGPFIAKVSLAAQECSTLDFPQPPYPYQVTCPSDSGMGHSETSSLWDVSVKVRWETLAWGFGTALGELPPYFIARAANLAGDESSTDNADQEEGFLAKVQLKMRDFVMKVGFWGILLCASIPNPLFDLAGITCGHFQVPFVIFFGATAIGKTLIKSQLQMIFVILAFNEKSLERVLESVGSIPRIGPSFRKVLTDFMDFQRAALHNRDASQSGGILKLVTEIIVFAMILYFVGSIINGLARSYQKRLNLKNKKREKKTSRANKRLKPLT